MSGARRCAASRCGTRRRVARGTLQCHWFQTLERWGAGLIVTGGRWASDAQLRLGLRGVAAIFPGFTTEGCHGLRKVLIVDLQRWLRDALRSAAVRRGAMHNSEMRSIEEAPLPGPPFYSTEEIRPSTLNPKWIDQSRRPTLLGSSRGGWWTMSAPRQMAHQY